MNLLLLEFYVRVDSPYHSFVCNLYCVSEQIKYSRIFNPKIKIYLEKYLYLFYCESSINETRQKIIHAAFVFSVRSRKKCAKDICRKDVPDLTFDKILLEPQH